jgi:hypothetical protein
MTESDEPTEREKWNSDQRTKRIELALKRRELLIRERESRRARWSNPLVLAIIGAFLAAIGNIIASNYSNSEQREIERLRNEATQNLEKSKAESQLILEVVKTANPDKAAVNLKFLVDTNLLTNEATRQAVELYVKNRSEGQGVALPSPAGATTSSNRDSIGCGISGVNLDIKIVAAALDKIISPEKSGGIPRPWQFSDDFAEKRLGFGGGCCGFEAIAQLRQASNSTIRLRLTGDQGALAQIEPTDKIRSDIEALVPKTTAVVCT